MGPFSSKIWNQMHMVISFLYYSYVLCSHHTTSLHTALLWGAICPNIYEYHGVSYNIQKIIISHYMGLKLGLKCRVAIFMNIITSEYFNIWHPILYIQLVGYMELPDQPPFDLSFWFFLISKCFFFYLGKWKHQRCWFDAMGSSMDGEGCWLGACDWSEHWQVKPGALDLILSILFHHIKCVFWVSVLSNYWASIQR